MEKFKVIYDFSLAQPKLSVFFCTIFFVILFIGIFWSRSQIKNVAIKTILGLIFLCFGMLITVASYDTVFAEYNMTKQILRENKYKVVTGLVENYDSDARQESFTVENVKFEFSDFDEGDYGYNNIAANGGKIKANENVRISYFNNGERNIIIKLEIEYSNNN